MLMLFRFKSFNMQFEELHQRQSQWTVPDPELRESLRLAVAEVLLPAYRSFIKRFAYVSFFPQPSILFHLVPILFDASSFQLVAVDRFYGTLAFLFLQFIVVHKVAFYFCPDH